MLGALFRHRRLAEEPGRCAGEPCERCLAPQLAKVERLIAAGEPIRLVVPAFPAKSPSPRKVLGLMPDRAEELALLYLQGICDEITAVHPPGARITICSDGRVFSDLVGVSDADVSRYGRAITALIARLGTRSLDTFSMEDVFGETDYAAMRAQLCERHAVPLAEVSSRVRACANERALFNGIQRFLFEDRVALEPEKTRTRVRNECKERAYAVIQRSNAWSRLVEERFPAALRLSIHPQHPHATKIGIRLSEATTDAWLTPWHGVAVRRGDAFCLMRRHEAEELGARLVARDGRPSHFEIAS